MKTLKLPFFLLAACGLLPGADPSLRRPAHTYSIVAFDEASGQMGVAVQSHWFSVGGSVTWAEAGAGAVATQSFIDPSYGALGLELMRGGKSAEEALKALLAVDATPDMRQVAMVDARGGVAVHTGRNCIPAAGHFKGPGYSCQANLMAQGTVWKAMATAFEGARGELVDRLMAALEAAEAEKGDLRGRQSAAVLVVAIKGTGRPWRDRIYDLRVEDHPRPLAELKRLIVLAKAYRRMNRGDELLAEKKVDAAMLEYSAAMEMIPDNAEAVFWPAITMATLGRVRESLPLFRKVFAMDASWAELLSRLPAAGQFPDDARLLQKILAQAPLGAPVQTDSGGLTLHGSLVVPAGREKEKVPVILIVSGSGPTDRDGNNPLGSAAATYRLLAEDLARAGIASLRTDKRGVGKSVGPGMKEADLRFDDYVADAGAWCRFLRRDGRFGRVGILGHSEGSLVGMLAARQEAADFFISVAGAGRTMDQVLLEQLGGNEEARAMVEKLKVGQTVSPVPEKWLLLFRPSVQPYLISWLKYDPAVEIARLKVPVLVVQGPRDLQVGMADARRLHAALPASRFAIIPDMNHVLKKVSGILANNRASYFNPDLPLAPGLVGEIVAFVKKAASAPSPAEKR